MPLNIADLTISSPDFEAGSRLADTFSADGGNTAPRLEITGVPADAVELALIVHDPDAPMPLGFTHWIVYGLPAQDGPVDATADHARTAENTAGKSEYMGPQPPEDHGDHHYYFTVYALDHHVEGTPTREEFLDGYAHAILEQNRLVGLYSN
ncbi:YbhB/YbcL family Raf kinase inhibitor-like protein [Pseudoclavibacter sp. JSM 162008]|uniref:YbhB/YbcL family Raf kinase inhibitor-like protein n=1 Tax=Pseudoclavibacter sp. JSM 162008 TaxID=3229855 RepID=UPI0035252FDB